MLYDLSVLLSKEKLSTERNGVAILHAEKHYNAHYVASKKNFPR